MFFLSYVVQVMAVKQYESSQESSYDSSWSSMCSGINIRKDKGQATKRVSDGNIE